MAVSYSQFAQHVTVETAFTVLQLAKQLQAGGKDVIELEIGDSPFATTSAASGAGIEAIKSGQTHYGPSSGLAPMRAAAAALVKKEFMVDVGPENIVVGPGAKIFELLFCEAFLDVDDGVLVFSPFFPTYPPNIARRGARISFACLEQSNDFRPSLKDVEHFLENDPRPKAIFLNSPHNPTGGVATEDDLRGLADLIRGQNVAVFSDEPYCHMVWKGRHHSLLEQPGMLDQCVAAYTMSKSYSMSGWRLGFAASSQANTEMLAKLVNTSLSCVPPMVQLAGAAALENDAAERDQQMEKFRDKVQLLTRGLNRIEGVHCLDPAATFYVFASVAAICNRHQITSSGLAMYLLEGADDRLGVACLGGESFGKAGAGFLRFSCAEPDDRLEAAVDFIRTSIEKVDRIKSYLAAHPEYRLAAAYLAPAS